MLKCKTNGLKYALKKKYLKKGLKKISSNSNPTKLPTVTKNNAYPLSARGPSRLWTPIDIASKLRLVRTKRH